MISSRSFGGKLPLVSSSKTVLLSSSISCSTADNLSKDALASSFLPFKAAFISFSSSTTVSIAKVICLSAISRTLDLRLRRNHLSIRFILLDENHVDFYLSAATIFKNILIQGLAPLSSLSLDT